MPEGLREPRGAFLVTLFAKQDEALHLPYALSSWAANADKFDFFIATPQEALAHKHRASPNLFFIVKPLATLEAALLRTLGLFNIKALGRQWKASTVHPALGSYFTEALEVDLSRYSHWGWVDSDVVLGNLSHFFSPYMQPLGRRQHDILTVWGYADRAHVRRDPWAAARFRNRMPNSWGPTLLVNTPRTIALWRDIEAAEQSRRKRGCVSGFAPSHKGHSFPGELQGQPYDLRCGPFKPMRSITYTAVTWSRVEPAAPPAAWWDDVVFPEHVMFRSGLSVFEACCAVDSIEGAEQPSCTPLYVGSEVVQLCKSTSAEKRPRRGARDPLCAAAAAVADGVEVCEAVSRLHPSREAPLCDVHHRCDMHRVCSAAYHSNATLSRPACVGFGFHRSSTSPEDFTLLRDHESARAVDDALAAASRGGATGAGHYYIVREPAYHSRLRASVLPAAERKDRLQQSLGSLPSAYLLDRFEAPLDRSNSSAVTAVLQPAIRRALRRAKTRGDSISVLDGGGGAESLIARSDRRRDGGAGANDSGGGGRRSDLGGDLGEICIVSMADASKRDAWAPALRSHRCYARRHHLRYSLEHVTAPSGGQDAKADAKLAIQYTKLRILARWLENPRGCSWLVWLDADLFIAEPSRHLREWLDDAAQLVMTDHHAAINNGAFIVRVSDLMRERFFAAWESATAQRRQSDGQPLYPFTDNGSMYEAILRVFAAGYAPWSCRHDNDNALADFLGCVKGALRDAFGAVRETGWRGSANGLRLYAPADGFNAHGCVGPEGLFVSCESLPAWRIKATDGHRRGWNAADMYDPELRMFGLHTKSFDALSNASLRRSFTLPDGRECEA